MFTNEFEWEASITTVMDETGEYQDVELIIEDDGVYIRQFPEKDNVPADLICMTHKMFKDMVEALKLPEGFYQTRYEP
jgi:hypothetical protein